MPILLRCHKGIGPAVTGTALVAADHFSARYDLDRHKRVFSRPSHKLAGQSYVDRILVLDTAKGGVATASISNSDSCGAPKTTTSSFASGAA